MPLIIIRFLLLLYFTNIYFFVNILQETNTFCCHDIDTLKVIDKKVYCAKRQELCETMCKGKDCNRIFVDSLTNNSIDDNNIVKYIPTRRNNVRACFNVNECGYALCGDCYT